MFSGWNYVTNLEYHYNGRIMIVWRPDYFQVTYLRAITCKVIHYSLSLAFLLTVVYSYNTKDERKEL